MAKTSKRSRQAAGSGGKASAASTAEVDSSAEQTRKALVMAGLKLFGALGYDGASTRDIAAAANANIGSIAYHFGGKDGLRLAVADHIVELVQSVAARAAVSVPDTQLGTSPQMAEAMLLRMLETMVDFFVARPESAEIVPFVLREMATPTQAFERVYTGVFEQLHRRLCGAWAVATGDAPESDETKLAVFTLIGQVLYFRLAREVVRRRMGWADIGSVEAAMIATVTGHNLKAALQARKDAKS